MNNQPEYPTREQAILNLQRYLRQLSYFDETIPAPVVSGSWEPGTEASLVAFQQKHNLPQTGRADEVTWNLLYEEYLLSVESNAPPRSMSVFPRLPYNHITQTGEESFTVLAIQFMLSEITSNYDNLGSIPRSGIYDESTALAIREFQRRSLLPDTGTVDKTTWNFLVEAYEIIFEDTEQ